ncbi:MAG: Beta-lactamase class C-like and penicillin binding proteins (PBPs) superfamily [uncultured Paraburkholderia sp.]|nr:MAG: Beta-lactamase class C-like and penicillin binding proteins (PBPs) superfamily [uncultured Paraburkholderia sp.]
MNHHQLEKDIQHLEHVISHISAEDRIPLSYWRNRIDSVSDAVRMPTQVNRIKRLNAALAALEERQKIDCRRGQGFASSSSLDYTTPGHTIDMQAGFSAARLAALTRTLQDYVERGATGYFEALGLRDEAAHLPMERDTLFRIASMTKPVASAAILMLVEEDRLALDMPIAQWLPELAAPRVLRDPGGPLDETDPVPRR